MTLRFCTCEVHNGPVWRVSRDCLPQQIVTKDPNLKKETGKQKVTNYAKPKLQNANGCWQLLNFT